MVAPVKGATAKIQELISWFSVSIHVPVKGATDAESWAMRAISGFNPRTRKGCDNNRFKIVPTNTAVSIHAPVKGATAFVSFAYNVGPGFQSTHP